MSDIMGARDPNRNMPYSVPDQGTDEETEGRKVAVWVEKTIVLVMSITVIAAIVIVAVTVLALLMWALVSVLNSIG